MVGKMSAETAQPQFCLSSDYPCFSVATRLPRTSGQAFSKLALASRCSPAPPRLVFGAGLRAMSALPKRSEGIEEPVGRRQRNLVNEILRGGEGSSIEGGDPAREGVDEAVQFGVGK